MMHHYVCERMTLGWGHRRIERVKCIDSKCYHWNCLLTITSNKLLFTRNAGVLSVMANCVSDLFFSTSECHFRGNYILFLHHFSIELYLPQIVKRFWTWMWSKLIISSYSCLMEIKKKMCSFPRRFCRGVVHKGTENFIDLSWPRLIHYSS